MSGGGRGGVGIAYVYYTSQLTESDRFPTPCVRIFCLCTYTVYIGRLPFAGLFCPVVLAINRITICCNHVVTPPGAVITVPGPPNLGRDYCMAKTNLKISLANQSPLPLLLLLVVKVTLFFPSSSDVLITNIFRHGQNVKNRTPGIINRPRKLQWLMKQQYSEALSNQCTLVHCTCKPAEETKKASCLLAVF